MSKVRVLIAEDHQTVREGLKMILGAQSDIEVVGEAGDGQTAVELTKQLMPDIVLMDLSMPKLNGLKATEKLKQACPRVNVLVLTRHTEDGYLLQLLRVGASGYVLKQSPPSEFLHAIRSIAGGGKYLDPAVAGRVIGGFQARKFDAESGTQEKLSGREAETLRLIAWGHSNKDIAQQLGLSVKTIEVHKANAMKKLGMRSRIDIVRFALLQGWMEET
jgi:two-component system, NarL family, response regulator NreC